MKHKALLILMTAFLISSVGTLWPVPAQACCQCEKEVQKGLDRNWFEWATATVKVMVSFFEGEFTTHKLFVAGIMWEDNILPAMMLMTEQISAVAMHQTQIIGTFFDAKIQMETQQLFQVEQAKIRKLYQPSQGMCEFGSTTKSLAASDRRGEITSIVLSQRAQDRSAGNAYSSAFSGPGADKESRVNQFIRDFCDGHDNNNGLYLLCTQSAWVAERRNKDIDYVRTMDAPWTLGIDFTNTSLSHEEEEIMALSSYLYGHEALARPPSITLESDSGALTSMQEKYMESRSIMAKRSVAQNSFNALASLKSMGASGSREFLVNVLTDLGVETPEEAKAMLGDKEIILPGGADPVAVPLEPSYSAQMEILTKKLYQNPDFYTNLYDTPVNVARKNVAMQAIGLMQKFDVFKSYLRQEASVSVLLELAVMEMQEDIENELAENK